jgi:salicylate hydroxylase
MVLSHPEESDPSTWTQETAMEDMRHHFAGWDSRWASIFVGRIEIYNPNWE